MEKPSLKLLDPVRQRIRLKGHSIRTEKSYVSWIKRYILFHDKRHPEDMGKAEIEAFLSHLAMKLNFAPSTQNQAFNAILFLYNHVLQKDMSEDIDAFLASCDHLQITYRADALFDELTTTLYQEKAEQKQHERFCYQIQAKC